MPTVSFNLYRDAGDQNYLCLSGSCVGPNTGTAFVDKPAGSTNGYSTSGSGPGSVGYRIDSSTQIGLDDRQGAGADNDYNDLIVVITSGNAEFRSNGMYVYMIRLLSLDFLLLLTHKLVVMMVFLIIIPR